MARKIEEGDELLVRCRVMATWDDGNITLMMRSGSNVRITVPAGCEDIEAVFPAKKAKMRLRDVPD